MKARWNKVAWTALLLGGVATSAPAADDTVKIGVVAAESGSFV